MELRNTDTEPQPALRHHVDRRHFLGLLGLTAGALLLPGCKKDEEDEGGSRPAIAIGSGDTGLMRFAFALESFMVLFYDQAIAARPANDTQDRPLLITMRSFHFAYQQLLKQLLNNDLPQPLEFDTTKLNFRDRTGLYEYGISFTEILSSAYAGLAARATDPERMLVLAKIGSSLTRQSTDLRRAIRTNDWTFRAASTSVSEASGLGTFRTPSEAVAVMDPFLLNRYEISGIN